MIGILALAGPVARERGAERLADLVTATAIRPGQRVVSAVATPAVQLGACGLPEAWSGPWLADDEGLHLVGVGDIHEIDGHPVGAEGNPADVHALVARAVLERYRRDPRSWARALVGEFVVGLWNEPAGDLWIVNDRFGLYPHYYVRWAGGVALAPSIGALTQVENVPLTLDAAAVSQFIRFQQLLDDTTWFEDIRVLPPASLLRYRPRDASGSLDRYWSWDEIRVREDVRFDDAVEECRAHFARSVERRLRPAQRPGIFLSGGLDGRTILAFAADRARPTTLTFGAPGCRDVEIARRLARAAGVPHHWFPLLDGRWVQEHAGFHLAVTDAQQSWLHGHGVTMVEAAREIVDVNLSGWDGGTVLGGSINFYKDHAFRHPASETDLEETFYRAFCQDFTWPGLTDDEAARLLDTPAGRFLAPLARETLARSLAATRHHPPDRRADWFYLQQVVRRSLQQQIVLARTALDVRCPYFDYDLVEFLYALPEAIRTTPRLRYAVLSRQMPALSRIPRDKDLELPTTHWWRRERQRMVRRIGSRLHRFFPAALPAASTLYADYENYLRHDLRAWAEDLLLRPRTLMGTLVRREAVEDLWRRHLSGELWTAGKIAPLMTLELLFRAMHERGVDPTLPTAGGR